MRVNKYLLPILVGVALLGAYGAAEATGAWEVSGKQDFSAGGLTSSEDVRGWMTLQQVADGVGLSAEDLYAMLGLPSDLPPETALKDLEGQLPDFETSSVRDTLAVYLGEVEPPVEEETPAAGPTLTLNPTPAPDAVVTEHTGPTPLPSGTLLAASEIKARYTLREVAEYCQVPLEALIAALHLPADSDPDVAIKDLASSGAIESVEAVRAAVEALQAP